MHNIFICCSVINTIIHHTVNILRSLVLVSNVPKGGESEPTIKQQTSASQQMPLQLHMINVSNILMSTTGKL